MQSARAAVITRSRHHMQVMTIEIEAFSKLLLSPQRRLGSSGVNYQPSDQPTGNSIRSRINSGKGNDFSNR